jgi:hypothetical protein
VEYIRTIRALHFLELLYIFTYWKKKLLHFFCKISPGFIVVRFLIRLHLWIKQKFKQFIFFIFLIINLNNFQIKWTKLKYNVCGLQIKEKYFFLVSHWIHCYLQIVGVGRVLLDCFWLIIFSSQLLSSQIILLAMYFPMLFFIGWNSNEFHKINVGSPWFSGIHLKSIREYGWKKYIRECVFESRSSPVEKKLEREQSFHPPFI